VSVRVQEFAAAMLKLIAWDEKLLQALADQLPTAQSAVHRRLRLRVIGLRLCSRVHTSSFVLSNTVALRAVAAQF
jgi:hypothetical protein